MKVVCGLGNPGPEYDDTRHNVGWWLVDRIAVEWKLGPFRRHGPALEADGVVGVHDVRLLKPMTWMNRSGAALGTLRNEEGFDPTRVGEPLYVLVDPARGYEPTTTRIVSDTVRSTNPSSRQPPGAIAIARRHKASASILSSRVPWPMQDSARITHSQASRLCGGLRAARALSADPLHWLLGGGDDHALAATFPPDVDLPMAWSVVGRVEDGEGVLVDGSPWAGPGGWTAF